MLRHLPQGVPPRMLEDGRHSRGRMELLQMFGEAVEREADPQPYEEDESVCLSDMRMKYDRLSFHESSVMAAVIRVSFSDNYDTTDRRFADSIPVISIS